MKRISLLSLLMMLLSCTVAFADKTENYVLFEGFESGSIPATWTQQNVSGSQQWVAEAGATATFPVGAYQGDYRVALRNNTAQTVGYVTKLISPVMDLANVYQPILVFSHAQMQRTGDVDTLKVYYRTSVDARWVKIGEYGKKTSTWETDTIALTGANATYQIAFEGIDNMGRGIVLDDIIVRPMPTCDNPSNITVDGLTMNSAILRWIGSLDTDSFHVVVSSKKITDMDKIDSSAIVLNKYVSDFEVSTESVLKRNTTYYAYVQAHCGNEESDWAERSFTTKNLVMLPYTQNFNLPYITGTYAHMAYWTYGTSITKDDGITMEYMPYVNQNTAESSLDDYSFDATTCLVFTGASNTSTAIPAGQYVYAATPELDIAALQNVQVSFWGTCYNYVDGYAHGLIVGAMTDPNDFSTFKPVDTVYVDAAKIFKEFVVTLENYTDNGKYIAFVSNFTELPNIFYLDKVEIKLKDALTKPAITSVTKTRAQSFMIHTDLKGATTYNVRVAKAGINPILDPTALTPDSLIADITGVTGADYMVNLPTTYTEGRFVQVYVQTSDGTNTSAWSLPYKVLLPRLLKADADTLLLMNFETSEYADPNGWVSKEMTYFSSLSTTHYFSFSQLAYPQLQPHGGMVPYMAMDKWPSLNNSITSANAYKGSGYALMTKIRITNTSTSVIELTQPVGDYFVLPEVDSIQNVMLNFYLRNYSPSVPNNSRVAVGVMSDPADPTTFDTVAVFDGDPTYRPCVVSFKNYTGNGTMIAIMAVDADAEYSGSSGYSSGYSYKSFYTSNNCIDYLTLTPLSDCVIPTNIVVDASHDQIDITWNANEAAKWHLKLCSDEKMTVVLTDTIVETDSVHLTGFMPHTTYYYTMAVICDTVTTTWLGDTYSFTTPCLPAEELPYTETFEGYKGGSTSQEIPYCWTMPLYPYTPREGATAYYPYIATSATYAHKGEKYLNFGSSSLSKAMYFALPVMGDSVKNLQISFWAKGSLSTYNDTLLVGVMTDPDDINTFEKVADILIKGNTYKEYLYSLANYAGDGKYIAIYKKNTQAHDYYIDDIVVNYIAECEKVQGVTMRNATPKGADITWNNTAATQWQVVVSAVPIDPNDLATVADSQILCNQTTTAKPYVFSSEEAEVNTNYYVYVRTLCDNASKGEWSNEAMFKTTCIPETVSDYGTETFSNVNALGCWTVGVREGTTTKPSRSGTATGKFGFYLYLWNSNASDGAYAIMPPLDIDSITRLQVSFDACSNSTSATNIKQITVGVITNAEDLSTFTALKTLTVPYVTDSTGAQRYTIRLNEYKGDYNEDYGKQLMFLSESGENYNYIQIDNISFDTIPTCLEPLEVTADSVGTYGAHLVWDGDAATNYQVKVSDAAIHPATDAANVLDTVVTGNAMIVNNLQMLQQYYVYVRTICGVGDTSLWSNERNFTTECPASYSLPYSEDFDSYGTGSGKRPSCWTSYYGTAEATGSYPNINTTKYEGVGSFYLYAGTATNISTVATPRLDADLSKAMLSFYYRSSVNNKAMYIGIAEQVDNLDSLNASVQWIDTIKTNTSFTKYTRQLSDYTGSGKYIVFKTFVGTIDGTSYTYGSYYIDNFEVELVPTCFKPDVMALQKATATTATVTWEEQATATQWDVAYGLKGADVATMPVVTVDTMAYTMTGLTANTQYDVYVRANCGAGDVSVWTAPLTLTTGCLMDVSAASWNFDDVDNTHPTYEGATAYIIDNCWIAGATGGGTTTNIPYNIKDVANETFMNGYSYKYAYSGEYALKLYSTAGKNAYAVLPEMNANLDTLQVRFKVRTAYYSGSKTYARYSLTYCDALTDPRSVKIGTVTDPYDISTFELLKEYTLPVITVADTAALLATLPAEQRYPNAFWEDVTVPLYGATGKYIVFLSDYSVINQVFVDDVVIEKEQGCAYPTTVKLDENTLNDHHADFTWKSSKTQWNVKLTSATDTVEVAVNTNSFSIDTLQPQTEYRFALQAICSGSETSDWTYVDFATPCAPVTDSMATWNFEDNLYQYGTSNTYVLPDCWLEGLEIGTAVGNHPYAVPNTTTYNYAKGGTVTDKSLRFYTTAANYNAYVVLPEIDKPLDSLALHFYGRAAYFYSPTYSTASNRNKLYAVNNKYSRTLVMGTLTKEDDFSTFEPLDTIVYPHVWSSYAGVYSTDDPNGNDYWVEYTMPLGKYAGKRIALVAPEPAAASYFFVDDLSIVPGDFCSGISNFRTTNITGNSATLAWTVAGTPEVVLQVATTEDFDSLSIVYSDTLTTTDYTLTGLNSASTYYARTMHLCSVDETSAWTSVSFATYYAVRFNEPFSMSANYPENWKRYYVSAENVFNGSKALDTPVAETATSAWKRGFSNIGMPTTHMVVDVYNTLNSWLVTPSIDLTSFISTDSLMLSFDLSLTDGVDHQGGKPSMAGTDDRFIVAVSTDNGATWTSNQAYIWNNTGDGNFVYNEISPYNGGQKVYLDFTPYAGNIIKIGFYAESTKTNANNDLHLDNVQLNRYTKEDYEAEICQYEDYADAMFTVDANAAKLGSTEYSYFKASTSNVVKDKLTILNLTVNPAANTTLHATRCEGEIYTDNNFNIQVAESGMYKQKLQSVSGCDSIVTLYLTVNPTLYSETRATICQGSSFNWHGVDYYRTTIVSDTVSSAVTGCDSIATLYLTVRAALESEQTVTLCYGKTLSFGKYNITEGGIYKDTLQTADGCDSIVTLTVLTSPELKTTVRTAICTGESYNDGTFVGISRTGTYPVTIPSVAGCDSAVTLKLTVVNALPFTLNDTVAVSELPYIFNGVTLWPVGTPDGIYTKTITLACGEITLQVCIGEPTGMPVITTQHLTVVENPVEKNTPFIIYGDFTAAERNGMIVKVFNSIGTLIYADEPDNYPITIAGLPVNGVYMVTITTGTKQVYRTKVIVE